MMGGSLTGNKMQPFLVRIHSIVIFYSLLGKGNIVPNAEFNFYRDPEAAFILLNAPKPLNITLFPVEGADHTNITVV